MLTGALSGSMSADFGNAILLLNLLAISMLAGLLFVDNILAGVRNAARAMHIGHALERLRLWLAAYTENAAKRR